MVLDMRNLWKKTETFSDEEVVFFVENRFREMSVGREELLSCISSNLHLRDRGLDSFKKGITPNVWKEPYTPATGMELNQSWKSELRENKPELSLRSLDPEKKEMAENAIGILKAIEQEELENHSAKVLSKVDSDTVDFGTGICFDGYDYSKKEIVCQYVDIRQFFPDEMARDMEECRDSMWRNTMTISEFSALFGDFPKAETVKAGMDSDNSANVLSEAERAEQKANKGKVKVYDFYSIKLKKHFVVANKVVLVNEEYSFSGLPFHAKYFLKNPDSFWGISNLQMCYAPMSAIQSMISLAFLNAKASMAKSYFVNANTGLQNGMKIKPNEVIPVKTGDKNINDVIQSFSLGGVPAEFFNMYTIFQDALTIASQQDQRALMANPNQLATQTKSKAESFQKRARDIIRENIINFGVSRMEHLVELLKTHIAEKAEKSYLIDGYAVIGGESKSPKFKKSAGMRGKWKATEESLKGEFAVEVVEKSDVKISKEEELKSLMRFFEVVSTMVQLDPNVASQIDFSEMMTVMAEKFGIDKKRILKNSDSAGIDVIEEEHKRMLLGIDVFVPVDETMEESIRHLEEHRKFLEDNGEKLDPSAFDILQKHILETWAKVQKGEVIEKIDPQMQMPQVPVARPVL